MSELPCPLFWMQHNNTREITECADAEFFAYANFTEVLDGIGGTAPPSIADYLGRINTATNVTWQKNEMDLEAVDSITNHRHVTSGLLEVAELSRTYTSGSFPGVWVPTSYDGSKMGGAIISVYSAPPEREDLVVRVGYKNSGDDFPTYSDRLFVWDDGLSRYHPIFIQPGMKTGFLSVEPLLPGFKVAMQFMSQIE